MGAAAADYGNPGDPASGERGVLRHDDGSRGDAAAGERDVLRHDADSRGDGNLGDPASGERGLLRHDDGLLRCGWCGSDPLYVAYHDQEWGRPVVDERALFEKLCLEGFQAGLSWLTVLRKREAFREVFAGFDPEVVAGFGEVEVDRLLGDARIIRSRAKIDATVSNARTLLELWEADTRLSEVVWAHAPAPRPRPRSEDDVAVTTPASHGLARTLKRLGFRFIGPTSAYAFLQSMGLVDDHLERCHVPSSETGPAATAR